jgi:UDP:flavonoid glycosyltransferase YjiC (YdhE family)
MRVLFSSTRGVGHFLPLVPLIEAAKRRGHEILVAGPPDLAERIESAGYPHWEFAAPPEDELDEVWSKVPTLPPDEANEVVVGEIFGRLDTSAALPRLREACETWRPDAVVRETAEFGSALAAERQGIPHARVGVSLAAIEAESLEIAAGRVDHLRKAAESLRRAPYLTTFPESLEDPAAPAQPDTRRFRDPALGERSDEEQLVYVTFGTVAGGFEQARPLFDGVIEALADLALPVLLTVGREIDPAAFDAPANVRIEQFVPQGEVLARAAAVVNHGGSGSVVGALAAGVPQVLVPLFADQPRNAERVEAVGAGLKVEPPAIRDALERVLEDPSYREAAERIAAEMRALSTADEALETLAA